MNSLGSLLILRMICFGETCAVMDIDTLGTFTMSHAAVNYLKKGGKGKGPTEAGVIISISATLHYTANWYQIHVAAAKVELLFIFHLISSLSLSDLDLHYHPN